MNGFRVVSRFDIDSVHCEDFKNDIHQLAVILYPPEELNEKFLIRLRDCVIKLGEDHPVKKWMKWVAESQPLSTDETKKQQFLTEIISSRFNLITDKKLKNQVINIIQDVPETTLSEQLLRSYLYLMVGNITRSDNILRDVINTRPVKNWQHYHRSPSLYHKIGKEQATQIVSKMSKHPANRRMLELFGLYLTRFYNDPAIEEVTSEIDSDEVESKIDLAYIESMAPAFVRYLRFSKMSEGPRNILLRNIVQFPANEQAYWIWPFIDIDSLISAPMVEELQRIEESDELWFIYLLQNEKLADFFAKKKGRGFLPARRSFLKNNLSKEESFMMSLYKLIELGDINQELIQTTIDFLTHE